MNTDIAVNPAAANMGMAGIVIQLVIYLFYAYCVFALAKKMGAANAWMAFIPLLNIYLFMKMAGKPGWWLILMFIPLVNIIVAIVALHSISKLRGHGAGFTLGLVFLGFIFLPILAFESKKA
jgi:Family of unknown function (DUF5684)